jgi:hypothetical protein
MKVKKPNLQLKLPKNGLNNQEMLDLTKDIFLTDIPKIKLLVWIFVKDGTPNVVMPPKNQPDATWLLMILAITNVLVFLSIKDFTTIIVLYSPPLTHQNHLLNGLIWLGWNIMVMN